MPCRAGSPPLGSVAVGARARRASRRSAAAVPRGYGAHNRQREAAIVGRAVRVPDRHAFGLGGAAQRSPASILATCAAVRRVLAHGAPRGHARKPPAVPGGGLFEHVTVEVGVVDQHGRRRAE